MRFCRTFPRQPACLVAAILPVVTQAQTNTDSSASRQDPYGELVQQLLEETAAVVRIGKSKLKDFAPGLDVPHQPELNWDQALAFADEAYRDRFDRRISFLRRYLTAGEDFGRIPAIGPTSGGMGSMSGSGIGWTHNFIRPEPREPISASEAPAKTAEDDAGSVILAGPTGPIGISVSGWHSHGDSTLRSSASLILEGVKAGDMRLTLNVDVSDLILSFSRSVALDDDEEIRIEIGGNESGRNGVLHFWAMITAGDEWIESRNYDPDLTITRRSDRRNHVTETFVGGFLHERRFYRRTDGSGRVVRRERIPLPEVEPVAAEKLAELTEALSSPDEEVARRAREALILQGDRVLTPFTGNWAGLDVTARKNCIRVAGGIGSPRAIRFLVDRFDDAEWQRADDARRQLRDLVSDAAAKKLLVGSYRERLGRGQGVGSHLLVFGEAQDRGLLEILAEAMRDPAQCRTAAMAIRWNGSTEAKALLESAAATSEVAEARKYAVQELKTFRLKEVER